MQWTLYSRSALASSSAVACPSPALKLSCRLATGSFRAYQSWDCSFFADGTSVARSIDRVFRILCLLIVNVLGDTSTALNGPSLGASIFCTIQLSVALGQSL